MKIVIFFAAVSAAHIFVGVEAVEVQGNLRGIYPEAVLARHGDHGLQVTFANHSEIRRFRFDGVRDWPIIPGSNPARHTMHKVVKAQENGRWIATFPEANLETGYRIHYWTQLGLSGRRTVTSQDEIIWIVPPIH